MKKTPSLQDLNSLPHDSEPLALALSQMTSYEYIMLKLILSTTGQAWSVKGRPSHHFRMTCASSGINARPNFGEGCTLSHAWAYHIYDYKLFIIIFIIYQIVQVIAVIKVKVQVQSLGCDCKQQMCAVLLRSVQKGYQVWYQVWYQGLVSGSDIRFGIRFGIKVWYQGLISGFGIKV